MADDLVSRIKALTEKLRKYPTVGERPHELLTELNAIRNEVKKSTDSDVTAAAEEMETAQSATPYEGGRHRRRKARKTKRRSTKKRRSTRRRRSA